MPISVAYSTDFVGRRFGRLVILRKYGLTPSQHLLVSCVCDCGNETIVRWSALNRPIHKGTLSCGCIVKERVKDIAGMRFGRISVIERVGSDAKCKALWKCVCDCGQEFITIGSSLRAGRTVSCGCQNTEQRSALGKRMIRKAIEGCKKPAGEASFLQLVRMYARNAASRGMEFNITDDEARKLFTQSCAYCGAPPSQKAGSKLHNGRFLYNGIDRVDSSRGYALDNLVPCCRWCNWMKREHPVDRFLAHVARIAKYHTEILEIKELP